MNRRQYPRLEIDIPAAIEFGGNSYTQCRLLNFSRGGAYLQCGDKGLISHLPDGYFAEHERLEAQFSIPAESLQAKVNVVYFHNGGLGLAFCDATGVRLFETLQSRLQAQSGGSPGKPESQNIDPARTRNLLEQMRKKSKRYLERNLPAFFDKAQHDLHYQIKATSTPQEESILFFTLNSLEQNREALIRRFLASNTRGFAGLSGEPLEKEAEGDEVSSEMALVEKREIDVWIQVNDTARRVESEVMGTLYQLEIGLSYLCQGNIHNELNPISPISLLTALKSLLDEYELDVKTIRLILNAFHKTLLSGLNELYTKLIQLLRQQGIDSLDKRLQNHRTILKSPGQAVKAGSSIGHLSTLLDLHPPLADETSSQGLPEAGQEAVLSTLASLSLQGGTVLQQVEKLLQQETTQPLKLSLEARLAIGASEELVNQLCEDPLITAEIRALLGSLKFLIIEAVLADDSLLENTDHPVRRLLDSIESLKTYINTGPRASLIRDRESQRLIEIAEAVESGRIEHVDHVTREILSLQAGQRERFEKNRRLAISRCLKDERFQQAQIKTYEALSNLLLNRRVSIAVDKLLHFGWVNLLVQSAMLNSMSEKSWRRYMKVVKLLVKLFQESRSTQTLPEGQQLIMLSTIRKGFKAYPVHPQGTQEFEDTLRLAMAEGERDESEFSRRHIEVNADYLRSFFRNMHVPQEHRVFDAVDPEWRKTVENIALDTWLVEQTEQGRFRRVLNLAWKNPAGHRYLLVDGNGLKARDEDLQKLASRFIAGRITLLDPPKQPIIERTIETILSKSYDGFKQETSFDPLTGLSNRRTFETELRKRMAEQQAGQTQHALLLIDLDKFQVVNDLCGFEGGDQLLLAVTDILLNYLPDEGFLARIGDDEFSLLLQGCDLELGYHMAETLRTAIDEYPFEWKGRMIPSSASIGIVQPEPSEQTSGGLMRAAQAAVSMAKEGGGNCTRIYLASDSAYQDHQQMIESLPAIKEALARGSMELYAQPIVPLRESEELTPHYEVLLRIRNAAGELETPQEFVRAAEQYDLMRAVDRWVVEAFFEMLESYTGQLPAGYSFSINLSGKSVGDGEFQRFLKKRINNTTLQTSYLGFEITETALVGDISDTATFIQEIRDLGCSFSLDDFGSGYASFSYLKDFPVDFVKIDGIFVREILNKPADYAMIKSITEIAHFMNKRVIAEYVSDMEIGKALQRLGVDYGQGYHFAKPRPLKEVLAEVVEPSSESQTETV